MRRKLIAGNWKMNGASAALAEVRSLASSSLPDGCDVLLCPPATLIARAAEAARGSRLRVGGQNCHAAGSGAHTGDVSAEMIADAGASHVILGHSERRADHGETDAAVREKARAARIAGLVAVICVGETEAERGAGRELEVIGAQLAGSVPDEATGEDTVVAYEPIWAIGSGLTPTVDQIAVMHRFVRGELRRRFGQNGEIFRPLYGGSVKPANAGAISAIEDVDGVLVGGASLKAADFEAIVVAMAG